MSKMCLALEFALAHDVQNRHLESVSGRALICLSVKIEFTKNYLHCL